MLQESVTRDTGLELGLEELGDATGQRKVFYTGMLWEMVLFQYPSDHSSVRASRVPPLDTHTHHIHCWTEQ